MAERKSFEERRAHLADKTDEELFEYFWELAERIVDPMIQEGRENTTPAVERSILLRMGFSSLEAAPIVNGVMERGLMGKGAGNVVWRLSKKLNLPYRDVGVGLAEGKYWDEVDGLFEEVAQ
ncbi:MAG TPA: ornithine aminomutase [Clostridiaceae bacterium]|nr:ornithine aminomutase [Clostridiaceae bacterium]